MTRDTFVRYGLAFKERFAPELENKTLIDLRKDPNSYVLELSTGELVRTPQIVLAVGITHFSYMPEAVRSLPDELLSHSYQAQ